MDRTRLRAVWTGVVWTEHNSGSVDGWNKEQDLQRGGPSGHPPLPTGLPSLPRCPSPLPSPCCAPTPGATHAPARRSPARGPPRHALGA
eukprot:351587-Chlamydomonas_euryale.AAC.1